MGAGDGSEQVSLDRILVNGHVFVLVLVADSSLSIGQAQ